MGQDESTMVDESTEPLTLKARDLPSIASYIQSSRCKKIVVLTGVGISTSAGIPDFRSPETGLYANLARLDLPYAEAVFSIEYFRQKPEPFYMLAHELYPGRFRPTITHSFLYLLEKKGILHKHFTQNIDCLDREAGVPGEKVVEAHGSFATQRCIDCKTPYPDEDMREHIEAKDIPRCVVKGCRGLVKPDIVFFGEALPPEFFHNRGAVAEADLVIVMGTSLTVQPFASLPMMAMDGVPRLLINLEQVGSLGSRPDDVLLLGDCDGGVRKLAEALGWLDELEGLWADTGKRFGVEPSAEAPAQDTAGMTKDEKLMDEVDKLTREVDEVLKLSKEHEADTRGQEDSSSDLPLDNEASRDRSDASTVDSDSQRSGGLAHIFGHMRKKSTL